MIQGWRIILHASALFWSIKLHYTLVPQSIHRLVDLGQKDKRLHHPHIILTSDRSSKNLFQGNKEQKFKLTSASKKKTMLKLLTVNSPNISKENLPNIKKTSSSAARNKKINQDFKDASKRVCQNIVENIGDIIKQWLQYSRGGGGMEINNIFFAEPKFQPSMPHMYPIYRLQVKPKLRLSQ